MGLATHRWVGLRPGSLAQAMRRGTERATSGIEFGMDRVLQDEDGLRLALGLPQAAVGMPGVDIPPGPAPDANAKPQYSQAIADHGHHLASLPNSGPLRFGPARSGGTVAYRRSLNTLVSTSGQLVLILLRTMAELDHNIRKRYE